MTIYHFFPIPLRGAFLKLGQELEKYEQKLKNQNEKYTKEISNQKQKTSIFLIFIIFLYFFTVVFAVIRRRDMKSDRNGC